MAEADPDSSDRSDSVVDLKHSSRGVPLFSIPSFFVGFGAADAAVRSPTSPLDFSLFGGLFSPKSPPPAPHRNRWFSDKVGLSLLSSSFPGEGDKGQSGDDSFIRDNIVLAPRIKPNHCLKSNSLPKNYVVPSSLSHVVNIHPLPCDSITDVWDRVVAEEHNSPRRSNSSPMDIISSQAYSRSSSLSAREMALSEDYTCIISHGPNPKTTHMFGDCILDCDPKELGTEEELEKPDNHMHSEAASAEKETDKGGVEDTLDILPGSSYKGDVFHMAINASDRDKGSLGGSRVSVGDFCVCSVKSLLIQGLSF